MGQPLGEPELNKKQSILLHLDPSIVDAREFRRAVRSFIGLIEDLSDSLSGGVKLEWGVKVREGSAKLEVIYSGPAANSLLAFMCLEKAEGGLEDLESSPNRPADFTDSAIRKVRVLGEVMQRSGGYVEGPSKRIRISTQASANADKILAAPIKDYGSIEGELVLISDVKGPKIGIKDGLTGKLITCDFPEKDIDDLAHKFHRRVLVWGLISYRHDAEIAKVSVEKHRILRERSDLPSADDVRGILRDH